MLLVVTIFYIFLDDAQLAAPTIRR